MVPTTNSHYNITPTTTHSSRWIPKVEETEDKRKRSGWTEVLSRHNKRPVYTNKVENDPFAGMKSCVNYELEIERLKQIVPKVMIPKPTLYTQPHYSRSSSPDTAHSSDSDNSSFLHESGITEQEKARFLTFVRNWTGDWKAGHFDDQCIMENSSSLWAEPFPWNYHPTASAAAATSTNTAAHYHLWHSQPVQNQSLYNHWQNQQPNTNRHGPIGMGRKKH
ncbi:hypothetical protein MFLAVUS_002405 [Mucor flavus]|uniref:Uncharacterized protein n=1 Tax=Mucor flavus TaxID=439312 RepID=A0ABP9YQ79_9FUNG